MSALSPASETALAALDDFLVSARMSQDAPELYALDGLLTALAIGPEPMNPGEWLPLLAGRNDGAAAVLMARFDTILRQLGGPLEGFAPLLIKGEAGQASAAAWCKGFRQGVLMRPTPWQPLLAAEENFPYVMPIAVHWIKEDGSNYLPFEEERLEKAREGMAELIPHAVIGLNRAWWKRAKPKTPAKTGRNDPCPCGSGQKYKRCCGAN